MKVIVLRVLSVVSFLFGFLLFGRGLYILYMGGKLPTGPPRLFPLANTMFDWIIGALAVYFAVQCWIDSKKR